MIIEKFFEISQSYKVILLDSYGVLRNHNGLIPGVVDCVRELQRQGKHLRVLTNNAARSPESAAENLARYGLSEFTASQIITSGATTRHFLECKIPRGKVAYLGTEQSAAYIVAAGLEAVPIRDVDLERCDEITAVAFLDDEGYDKNTDIDHAINLLRHRLVPVVVANTDLLYPVSKDRVALATGSVARLAEYVLGRKFIRFGKPASQMFQFALESINPDFPDVCAADVLMVGDTLHTDILGGNTFGIATALVLSGNTRPESAETTDYRFVRLIRPYLGRHWPSVKATLISAMPPDLDPDQLDRYIDDSERPSINVNAHGVEPRFYAHRDSKYLLEFYPSK